MHMQRRNLLKSLAALPLSMAAVGRAVADQAAERYPNRPIRFVVPFAAGSSTDIAGRVYGNLVGNAIKGASVIIENRPGTGGNLGANTVARAAPDGYTILYSAATPMVIAPVLYPDLPYDPIRNFVPIAVTISVPLFVVVPAASGIRSLEQLKAHIKQSGSAAAYGSNGIGTSSHITARSVADALGMTNVVHAPYRQGSQAVMADLIGGRLTYAVDVWSVVGPMVKSGRLRALAVTSSARLSAAPDVPTLSELLKTDLEIVTWNALWAPAGTPSEIVTLLYDTVEKARQDKALVTTFEDQGTPLLPRMSPAQTREFMLRESQRWKKRIVDMGIRL